MATAGSSEPPSPARDGERGAPRRRAWWSALRSRRELDAVGKRTRQSEESPAGKNDGSGIVTGGERAREEAGCLGRMRARGTLAWVVCTRVRRSASNAWSRKVAGWSTTWRKMGSTRVSPARGEHRSSREANGGDIAAEEATETSPVRPFDHGAIVASEPTGAAPLIFGGAAATPSRLSKTPPRDDRDEQISGPGPGGFRTPRGTHVAMASLASGGGIGSMRRTLGGASPLATVRGAATKYATKRASSSDSPSYGNNGNKNKEVYSDSDSDSDAEQAGGGGGRRGRGVTPGFRLYDGLTRADGDDDKENRYDDRYDAKTPKVFVASPVAAALASLPPFIGDRYDDRYDGDVDRRARVVAALGDASNGDAAANAAANATPLGDKSLLRATSQSSLAIIRAASGGTRSTTTTVTTTVTTRVRGDTAGAEEETREMELFAALEKLVANH